MPADEDEAEGNFAAITGNTMRDTQRRIIEILHMDYDTFTNTAFLQQGRADQFTRSTPSQRKACLAEVLDLSYYQRLEARAKTRRGDSQERARAATPRPASPPPPDAPPTPGPSQPRASPSASVLGRGPLHTL